MSCKRGGGEQNNSQFLLWNKVPQPTLMQASVQRKLKSSTPSSLIHAAIAPDNRSTSSRSLRQALGSTLCPRLGTSVWTDPLVRHHALPATTVWQLLLPHQPGLMGKARREPSRQSGSDRTGVSACPSAPAAVEEPARGMRVVTARRRPANWQELKMAFTAAPRQA